MRTYARIQDGRVAELLKTDGDITGMFNPALIWVEVTSLSNVAEGWHLNGTNFAPSVVAPPTTPVPTLAELKAKLAAIGAQLAALSDKS
jgi:hypothetical protein